MKKIFPERRRSIYLTLLILFTQSISATDYLVSHDIRSFTLGDIHALSEELLNPAALSFSGTTEAGLTVFNRFNMKELNTASLYLKYPNRWLDGGSKLSVFGYKDYQIIYLQIALAKKVHSSLSLGIHFNYLNESSILKENREGYYSSHFGAWYVPCEKINLALLIENLLSSTNKNPVNGYLGIKYLPLESIFFLAEGKYLNQKHFSFSLGLEYLINKQFILRSGFQVNPELPSFGITYLFGRWNLSTGFSFHTILGINSSIGISVGL